MWQVHSPQPSIMKLFRTLYLIPWSTDFALMLIVFTVSRELAEMGHGLAKMGLVGAVSPFAMVFSSIVGGRLSDRLGRRRVLVSGAVLLLLCPPLAASSWYFLSYSVLGFGSGLIYAPVLAWISHGGKPGNQRDGISRTLISWCLAWNLGIMAGQLSGGWLFAIDRAWPLTLAFCLFVANLAIALFADRGSTKSPASPSETRQHEHLAYQDMSANFARLAWVANLGGAFSMSMMIHLFPKLAVELGVPSEQHGIMIAMSRIVTIATYVAMHHLKFWHHRFSTALLTQAFAVAGLLAIANATAVLGLCLGLGALSLMMGYNYFAGIYYTTTGSADERKGAANGIHEATIAMGFGCGSLIGGLIGQQFGVRTPYLLGAGVIVIMALVQLGMWSQQIRARTKLADRAARR